jgi:hypothetical protein
MFTKTIVKVVGLGGGAVLLRCVLDSGCIPGVSFRELEFSYAVWQRMMILLVEQMQL